jgi:hypothetical protein
MNNFKLGTLSADGVVYDHALGTDGEYRIAPRRPSDPEVVLDEDEAPSADPVDMVTFFPHWNRLRRL